VACVVWGGPCGLRRWCRLLASLPVQVQWIDSRDGIFPTSLPDNVVMSCRSRCSRPCLDARGALVLIMSFSHAQDLDLVAACLSRQRQTC
jgi:xanthine dehydrogenase accessory factor